MQPRPQDPDELVDLTTATTEFEAEAIVAALGGHGIEARVMGGALAGFRAEAPAVARILVRAADLPNAKDTLRAIKADSVDIDWEEVDVGVSDDPAFQGDGVFQGRAGPPDETRGFWRTRSTGEFIGLCACLAAMFLAWAIHLPYVAFGFGSAAIALVIIIAWRAVGRGRQKPAV